MIEPGVRTFIPSLKIGPNDPHSHHLYTSALAHFRSIPWTASLLQAPNTTSLLLQCRNGETPKHDQFFTKTLAGDGTISQMITFFNSPRDSISNPSKPVEEVSTLFQLGEDVSGYPSISHGGLIMSMVDEAMGSISEVNYALGKELSAFQGMSFTGELNIKFLKPLYIPGTIIITSRLERTERRRSWIKCEVKDCGGEVLATCSSTWVMPKPKM